MIESSDIKKIAVFGSHISWDGGVDFLCYLVESIKSIEKNNSVEIYLILPHNIISKVKSCLLQLKFARKKPSILWDKKTTFFENKNIKIIQGFKTNNIPVKIVYYNYSQKDLALKLKKIEADVVFPSILSFGVNFTTPWVGYIPDLQHKHFPLNFSRDECNSRDIKYQNLLNDSKALFVNSIAARNDLIQYYSTNEKNIFSLPFCPPAPLVEATHELVQKTKQTYNLPEHFFIISNQFWKHKSHITAFEALAEFIHEGRDDIEIICTGKPYDDKDPAFVESLLQQIKVLGIENKIRFTGFIPKVDQLILMSLSTALIQPTLFEGGPGGGSVYNAISYGTPCIISDIEINKEVKGDNVYFFKAGNSKDLKEKMKQLIDNSPSKKSYHTLREEGNKRTKELGYSLLSILEKAAQ